MHAETLREGGRSNYRLQDIQLASDARRRTRSLTARRQQGIHKIVWDDPPTRLWRFGETGSRACLTVACKAREGGTPGSKFAGGHRIRVTPVPIPNTEVKPDTADGTAWETVWESRSLPALFQ